MIRILQLSARGLVSPSSLTGLNGVTVQAVKLSARPVYLGLELQRPFCVSSFCYKQQGSSSSSSSSSSNDQRGDKKRRSLMDVANDTLESAGIKTSSKSGAGKAASGTQRDGRQEERHDDNSMSKRRSSGQSPQRDAKTAGGSWGDSTTNVGDQKYKSSDRSKSKPVSNHRATGPVRHDKKAKQFVLDLGNNQVARIDYKQIDKGRIELYHTEVPEELRGKGIGKALTKGALESASRENLRLKVTCEYLQDYLKRFADDKYRKLVD
jgi:predicted GNAT family acetyltransferase